MTRSAGSVVVDELSSNRWRVGTAVLVGLMAVVAMVFGVRAAAADRLARDSLDATSVDAAVVGAQRASELAPNDLRHRLLVAETFERQRSLGGVDRALDAVSDAARISPLDFGVRYTNAHLLAVRAAITGSAPDRVAAEQAWDAVLGNWPMCARCSLGAATAALERGDTAAARVHLEVAVDLGSEEARSLTVEFGED